METFSINRLAELTGVDRRTVKKYLSNYAPDKSVGKREEYTIKTLCRALAPLLGDGPTRRGGDDSEEGGRDPSAMDPKDQKDWYDAQNKRIDYEAKCRKLIPADEVLKVVSETAKILVFGLDTVSDRIELEVGLAPDQRRVFMEQMDESRYNISHELGRYLRGELPEEFEEEEDADE